MEIRDSLWEEHDELVYYVDRTRLGKREVLHYSLVCPYCMEPFDVGPQDGHAFLAEHLPVCPKRPKGAGASLDDWVRRRVRTLVLGGSERVSWSRSW